MGKIKLNSFNTKVYRDLRDLNLVDMLLSLKDNERNDPQKIVDLLDVYGSLEDLNISDTFRKSLQQSRDCIIKPSYRKKALQQLQLRNGESFVLLDITAKQHKWTALVRKTEEGFSTVVINKGSRLFHHVQEEFVFGKNNLRDLMKVMDTFKETNNIEDVYRSFKEKSEKQYILNTETAPQKTGNCYIKNMEAAIKFAYATSTMSSSELKKFRNTEQAIEHHVEQKSFKPKWRNMAPQDVHQILVQKIAQNNPDITSDIYEKLERYKENKKFGELIESGKSPMESFLEAFNPISLNSDNSRQHTLQESFSKLTLHTIQKYSEELGMVVEKTKDPKSVDAYKELVENIHVMIQLNT